MCTAISFQSVNHYFGRNLDLEYHYSESVTITPRRFPFHFRETATSSDHSAIIGVATIIDGYPLYYDATNEFGLSIAALNFPGNAVYNPHDDCKLNICAFELIPYILSKFKSVEEVKSNIGKLNIVDIAFRSDFPVTPLHWLVADKDRAIVIEQVNDGLHVYDNPIKVLTNNPPFSYHLDNLNNYLNITAKEPFNRFSNRLDLNIYSRGMGAIGLPGDLSSSSRFVRAAFVLHNSSAKNDAEALSQFFHILGSVEQPEGCVFVEEHLEKTIYTSCCNTDKGIYYYTTYSNRQISSVDINDHNLSGNELISYPLRFEQQVYKESK